MKTVKAKANQKSELEREIERLKENGYIIINPDHNAIKLILSDLGKADLPTSELEDLCKTAKCVTLNGFVRYDAIPCGCGRVYKGMILGAEQTPTAIKLNAGGIEGVKPCPKHTALIEGIKWTAS